MEKQYALRVGLTLPADVITLNFVVTGETGCFNCMHVHFDLGWK
jgi:hypothetical protein